MKQRITFIVIALLILAPGAVYFAFPGLMYSANIGFFRCRAGLEQKSVQVDDHNIAYLEGGAGPAVLLLHGFGSEKDHWARFARHLTPCHRVVIPDIPGFGESSKIDTASYDMKSQAARIERFCSVLGIDRYHVVGNSMGGFISALVAIDEPGRVISLCLMDNSGVTAPEKSEYQRGLERGENLLLVNTEEDFDRMMALNFVSPPKIPGPVKRILVERAKNNRAFNQKISQDRLTHPLDLGPMLYRIKAPALVIWGDSDRVLDKSAVPVLKKGIARSTVVIMDRCGHVPMFERPDETAKHYLDFLGTL